MGDQTSEEGGQRREIGPVGALSTVAGSMLGVGIFIVPPVVGGLLPAGVPFFSVWVAAALAAASGAVAYAELGVRFPEAGGDYVFQRHAYGRGVAFASGWVLFAGIFTGSVAALSVPLFRHQVPTLLGGLWPGAAAAVPQHPMGVETAKWGALALIWTVTAWNGTRARVSAAVQTLTTVVPIAILTLGGLYVLAAAPAEVTASTPEAPSSWYAWMGNWVEAYVAVYFAYSGWNAVIYVAGEVEEPERTLPIGLVGGTVIVTVVYLILCGAYVETLGFGGLAEAGEAGSAAAGAVAGESAELGVAAVIAVAMVASLNATILGGARVAYAMAREGAFPTWFDSTNAHGVPVRALGIQAAIASVFVLTGTFEQILELVGLAMMFVGATTVVSIWVLRRLTPDEEVAYEATGFPWFPAIYVGSSGLVVVYELVASLRADSLSDAYPVGGLILFGVALAVGWWREWR